MHITISDFLASVQPSLTLALTAKAKALKAQGVDVLAFTAGEPDFDTPLPIREAVVQALMQGGEICKYTAAAGLVKLRSQIAAKFKRDNGLDYHPDNITVGAGAKQVIFNAIAALVNPGDEVLMVAPYWVSYPEMTRAVGGKPVIIDASKRVNFAPTTEDVRAAISDRTKVLILNSPNNPGGSALSRDEFAAIYAALEGTDIVVLSDEIYEYLVYDDAEHVSPAGLSEDALMRTLTINGHSKAFAMTGWRIGFAGGPAALVKAMNDFQSHTTSSPTTVSQYASMAAFDGGMQEVLAMRESFNSRRKLMVDGLNAIKGIECQVPKGAFYAFPKVSGIYREGAQTSMALCERLLEEVGLALVPGSAFGTEDFVRLSYACDEDTIQQGLERLRKWVG